MTNYHQDGRNSVVLTTNATTGAVIASQQFDAFGNVQASSGSVAQYGFTGREPDASGLMYCRARYYDPGLGRFTQRDPKGFVDGINRYAYVRNNPVNRIDPRGTVSQSTNNYSSLNNNYFSGGGSSSQTLANTNNNFDAGATAQLTKSVGGDTSFLSSIGQRVDQAILNTFIAVDRAIGLPTAPQGVVDAVAGFGDGASFGLTNSLRDSLGINGVVNQDSTAFNVSKVAGTLTTSTAATLRGAAFLGKVGGGTRAGHFINHNRFIRVGPGRMPTNGSLPAGSKVPRLSIGRGPGNPHVDLRVRPID